jgi:hypothetical protein
MREVRGSTRRAPATRPAVRRAAGDMEVTL